MIEVMVVMTIIAVTATLFMTTISDVRQAARAAACQTNLRQFHLAIFMFSDQRPSGRLPTGHWGEAVRGMAPPLGGYSGDQFGAYLSDLVPFGLTDEVLHCPGLPEALLRHRERFWWQHRDHPPGGLNGNDYVYQGGHGNHSQRLYGWHYGHPGGYFLTTTTTLDSYRDPAPPSEVLYMSDIAYNVDRSYAQYYYGRGKFGVGDPSNHVAPGQPAWQAALSDRLHADGHATTFTIKENKYGKWVAKGWWAEDYFAEYW